MGSTTPFKRRRRLIAAAALAVGMIASSAPTVSADGTEELGPPSIPIAEGTDLLAAGTGTFDGTPSDITLEVPAGVTVEQVLLYWEGQHSGLDGTGADDTISADGNSVTGTLIGGPTFFFFRLGLAHHSSTYRADITSLGLVSPGTVNTISIDDIDFDRASNGAGIIVIVDDGGTTSSIDLVDGNDLAFRDFASPLDTTMPQTLTFAPSVVERTAEVTIFASSVAGPDVPEPRPNVVEVTVDGVTSTFVDQLGSTDGNEWDTLVLPITVPAGVTELTVQLLSVAPDGSTDRPASLAWNAAAVSIPNDEPAALGDRVFEDLDDDGVQDPGEPGVPGVTVNLWTAQPDGTPITNVDTTTTNGDGNYLFTGLTPGQPYVVQFIAPDGTTITIRDQGDDSTDSDADPTTGITGAYVLDPGETDLTADAGIIVPEPGIEIEKATNGNDADDPDGSDVPVIAPGDPVTWTYEVTNTGEVAYDLAEVDVTDDIVGATDFDPSSDVNGDEILSPGETWIYTATGTAEDISSPATNIVTVTGCDPDDTVVDDLLAYQNVGTVTVPGATDSDPSHYCNPLETAALGDFVWEDLDEDGVQDAGEPGVEGVTVRLWESDAAGNPQNVVATTTTGTNGEYLFEGLTPGQPYVVQFEAPADATFTLRDQGGDDTVDSDPDPTTGITGAYVLAPGETNPTVDAGIVTNRDVCIEHEDMHLWKMWVQHVDGASNGAVAKGKPWWWGKAKTVWDGPAGTYKITTDYYDENDGETPIWLFVNGELIDSWVADQDLGSGLPNDDTKVSRMTLDVVLHPGDVIKWKVKPKGHEYGRLDRACFHLTGDVPPPPPMQMFEAEHMHRCNVWIERVHDASGGKVVRTSRNSLGYVSFTYDGSAGDFHVSSTYFDETDGQSRFWIYVNGVKIDEWRADQDLASRLPTADNRVERDHGVVTLEPGDRIKVYLRGDGYEFARLDKITLTTT